LTQLPRLMAGRDAVRSRAEGPGRDRRPYNWCSWAWAERRGLTTSQSLQTVPFHSDGWSIASTGDFLRSTKVSARNSIEGEIPSAKPEPCVTCFKESINGD
jgi:hypothetical protein